jgi:hypothetical protein
MQASTRRDAHRVSLLDTSGLDTKAEGTILKTQGRMSYRESYAMIVHVRLIGMWSVECRSRKEQLYAIKLAYRGVHHRLGTVTSRTCHKRATAVLPIDS